MNQEAGSCTAGQPDVKIDIAYATTPRISLVKLTITCGDDEAIVIFSGLDIMFISYHIGNIHKICGNLIHFQAFKQTIITSEAFQPVYVTENADLLFYISREKGLVVLPGLSENKEVKDYLKRMIVSGRVQYYN
jgi:hypothetical protein